MTNTLTNLYPTIYAALDVVSHELVGFIPAVTRNGEAERAAVGENIVFPVVAAIGSADIAPANVSPSASDFAAPGTAVTISKAKSAKFYLTGEEMKGLRNGSTLQTVVQNAFAQCFRTLANLIEVDLFTAAQNGASRAYGTAGTAPFATAADLTDLAQTRKILADNGCPMSNLHLVLNTTAAAALRGKMSNLFRVNEAGSSDMLRSGNFGQVEGFYLHESGGITTHTKGTGTSYQMNGAGAIGATTLAVDTGSNTIVQGDVITIANGTPADSNKYVVNVALSGGNVGIGAPGLISSHVDNDAITILNNYLGNFAFDGAALFLAARLPAAPESGDLAVDSMTVIDPFSGLPFEIRVYPQYHQVMYEVGIAWGYSAIKSAHIATLLG